MQARQKLFFAGIGGIFVLSLQFASGVVTSAEADHHVESTPVKYVMTVDYPVGGKADYIAWVTSVAADLQAPPELQRIASYDNTTAPHLTASSRWNSIAWRMPLPILRIRRCGPCSTTYRTMASTAP